MPPSAPRLPRVPFLVLRLLAPRAERDEILADLAEEYAAKAARDGGGAARRWLWNQAFASSPALLRWSWWRSRSGYEPRANAFRPGDPVLKTWMTDARYAMRRLRVRPGYTFLAVLTLALGIGGTAAVFGIARPLIFDRLPYPNADRVVTFWMPGWWTEEELLFMRRKYSGFTEVAGYRPNDVTLAQTNAPTRLIRGIESSAELFSVLGSPPLIGRTFRRGDDAQGSEPTVVISYGLWQELGGKPSILGTRLTLGGLDRTVIGVMPRKFWFPDPAVRVWLSRPLDPQGRNGSYALLGTMAPGVTAQSVSAHLPSITSVLGARFKYSAKADKTRDAQFKTLRDELLGKMRPAIVAMFVAMGLILLIACANVAALMLGQVEGRASELAVRSALGATHARLLQQIIIEALLVGVAAGLCGAALAAAGFHMLAGALPIGAWAENASFDWSVFVAALAMAVVAVLLVVLAPAVTLWRGDLRGALNRARTGGIQGRGGRLERGLVVIEVALAMLIASGAALLVRSVSNLYAINPGIDPRNVAVIDVVSNRNMRMGERARVLDNLTHALSALPGVRSAAVAMKLPLRGGGDSFDITIEGKPGLEATFTYFRIVSQSYFSTMGITLRAGRLFDSSDRPLADNDTTTREIPVIINEALAKKFFPGENPLGRRMGGGFNIAQRVIGVVNDVAEGALTDQREPVRYYLGGQAPWFGNLEAFVLKTRRAADLPAVLDAARQTVNRVAPQLAVQTTTTMERELDRAVGPARQVMTLLSLLSGLALVLGAIGIYGVISHFAARRTRDWAIRVALGLPGSRVVTHIVGQGVALVAVGVVLGAIGTLALAHVLASLLFGVTAFDAIAFAAASLAMLVIGVVAAFIPARRAGTVDPALVLREQ